MMDRIPDPAVRPGGNWFRVVSGTVRKHNFLILSAGGRSHVRILPQARGREEVVPAGGKLLRGSAERRPAEEVYRGFRLRAGASEGGHRGTREAGPGPRDRPAGPDLGSLESPEKGPLRPGGTHRGYGAYFRVRELDRPPPLHLPEGYAGQGEAVLLRVEPLPGGRGVLQAPAVPRAQLPQGARHRGVRGADEGGSPPGPARARTRGALPHGMDLPHPFHRRPLQLRSFGLHRDEGYRDARLPLDVPRRVRREERPGEMQRMPAMHEGMPVRRHRL